MIHRTLEEELDLNKHVVVQVFGTSMEPLLHDGKSTVVIESINGPLCHNDVVLYRYMQDRYVLHRVIKSYDTDCMIRGDNCIKKEMVPKSDIVGIMIGYYEDENSDYISCKSTSYQTYLKKLSMIRFFCEYMCYSGVYTTNSI